MKNSLHTEWAWVWIPVATSTVGRPTSILELCWSGSWGVCSSKRDVNNVSSWCGVCFIEADSNLNSGPESLCLTAFQCMGSRCGDRLCSCSKNFVSCWFDFCIWITHGRAQGLLTVLYKKLRVGSGGIWGQSLNFLIANATLHPTEFSLQAGHEVLYPTPKYAPNRVWCLQTSSSEQMKISLSDKELGFKIQEVQILYWRPLASIAWPDEKTRQVKELVLEASRWLPSLLGHVSW